MKSEQLSGFSITFASAIFLGACATQSVDVPPCSESVAYLDQAAVAAYVTGNTEEFSKGAGFYADDGTLLLRWEGKDLAGTYDIKDDGRLCVIVAEWGGKEDCQQYADVEGDIFLYYEGKPKPSVMKDGNALDAY